MSVVKLFIATRKFQYYYQKNVPEKAFILSRLGNCFVFKESRATVYRIKKRGKF
jgi:hypothetical protein